MVEGVLWLPNFPARSEEETAPAPTAANLPFVVQSLSRVGLFATPWTAAHQASLSFAISRSLVTLTSIESMMPSNHLILCRPLIYLASRFSPGACGALTPSRSWHSDALPGHRLPQPLITWALKPWSRQLPEVGRSSPGGPKRTSSNSPLVSSGFLAPSLPCTQLAPDKLAPGYDR